MIYKVYYIVYQDSKRLHKVIFMVKPDSLDGMLVGKWRHKYYSTNSISKIYYTTGPTNLRAIKSETDHTLSLAFSFTSKLSVNYDIKAKKEYEII